MRNFLLGGVCSLAIAGTLALVTVPGGGFAASSDVYRQLNLFGDIFERIRNDYVEEPNDSQMIEAAINGMLVSLDPHSSYLSPKNYRDMQVQTRGEFGGLGIEVSMENGLVKVVSPIDDTPAARAGIQSGDFITAIDGQQVLGLTLAEAVEKMRGPVNSTILLNIQRGNQEQSFEVTLTRAVIKVQSVRSRREGDVGYVRITTFNEQTDQGLKRAVEGLKNEIGADKIKGYVIDLRNNPGGLLDQAIAVSDAFLDQGEIVSTRGRRTEDGQRYNARKGDITDGKPLVVLVNGGSASASEIVAGALQDHRRAAVLGTKSFGKGSVQTIIPLGAQGALRLTTARYFTPAGRSIQAKGIEPDIIVEPARAETLAGTPQAPRQRSEADLPRHLSGDPAGARPTPPAAAPAPTPAPDAAKPKGDTPTGTAAGDKPPEDIQLQRALDLLRGLAFLAPPRAN
jgi:carboxyl-terminal processing protease